MFETVSDLSRVLFKIKHYNFKPIFKFSKFWKIGGGDVKRLCDELPKSLSGFQIKGFPNMKTLTTIYNFQATVLLHLALSIELLDLCSCCVT